MKMLTPFNPEPGSPVARVLDLLARNPEDGYSSSDLALKFQVKAAAWPPLLAKARAMGLVTYTTESEDDPKVWGAGPALAAWVAARAGTATPVAKTSAPAALARSKRGGTQPRLPPLDLSKITVERGIPVAPRGICKRGHSKWAPALALLKSPGDSYVVPMPYREALGVYIRKALKAGHLKGTYIVRPCVVKIGMCRVSRTG